MSKYVVILKEGDREQRNAITALLQGKGWALWHRMEDVWLLAKVPPEITARKLSDEISALPQVGQKAKLVMKFPDGSVAYWGNSHKEGWDWMSQFWGRPG
jgi:hypothetical protein